MEVVRSAETSVHIRTEGRWRYIPGGGNIQQTNVMADIVSCQERGVV
jgi:hypothetical protein